MAPTLGLEGRNCREERDRVWVPRFRKKAALVGNLDDPSEVHYRHAVADVFHHREVMRDEQVAEAKIDLQIHQQIDHLRLHGYVKRRDRLVEND